MKSSARNHYEGTVSFVREGAINDEVELTTLSGIVIVATVTRESRDKLGLQIGATAFALIKASSIVLVSNRAGVMLSARNQLSGTVADVTPGAVNTEVVLALPDGESVTAIITNGSAEAMALAAGAEVTAIFKASSVIVGVER